MEWGSALCMSLIGSPVQNVQLFTDASDVGFSCYFQGHWCQGKFPDSHFQDRLISMNWRELYTIAMALAIWGDQFKGNRIMVHCDKNIHHANHGQSYSKSKSMMVLVHSLTMFGMQYNFDLHPQHIPRVDSGIANALSRFNHEQFWHIALGADTSMTLPVSFPFQ